jgi:hypothetical protein
MRRLHRSLMAATAGLAGLVVLASWILIGPLHAQTKGAPAKSNTGMSGQGHMGMMGMMSPMNMTGTVMMNGKTYEMRCSMKPIGSRSSQRMMGGNMDGMMMNQPMKMNGTMAMMGQKYRCDMQLTPTGQGGSPQRK